MVFLLKYPKMTKAVIDIQILWDLQSYGYVYRKHLSCQISTNAKTMIWSRPILICVVEEKGDLVVNVPIYPQPGCMHCCPQGSDQCKWYDFQSPKFRD